VNVSDSRHILSGAPSQSNASPRASISLRTSRSYLHADEQTMLTAVLSGVEVRDVKKA
jgi:hypothetical protein